MSLLAIYALARPDVWIAAPPFLPPGRGGLILITGGLSMLALALFLLTVTQHALPGGVTQAHGHPGRQSPKRSRSRGADPARASTVATHGGSRRGAHRAVLATAMESSAAPGTQLQWPEFVQRAAAAEGLGRPHLLSVQGTRATLLVEHCDSCRRRKGNCKRERRALQRAARRLSRQAEVREVSCNIDRRHACAFELRMRGRS